MSIDIGLVQDSGVNWEPYVSPTFNLGYSEGVSFKMGSISTTRTNEFLLDDFNGFGNSYSGSIMGLGAEYGGTSPDDGNIFDYRDFGASYRGYTTRAITASEPSFSFTWSMSHTTVITF